jgi:hypothetical protein
MTAYLTAFPRKDSAVSFILVSTIDEISSGWNFFYSPLYLMEMIGLSSGPASTLNGHNLMSF